MCVMWLNRKLDDVIPQSQELKNALKRALFVFLMLFQTAKLGSTPQLRV